MTGVRGICALLVCLVACADGEPSPAPSVGQSEELAPAISVGSESTETLAGWLADPTDSQDPRKLRAAVLLAVRRDPAAIPALALAVLDERSPRVRKAAAEALGGFAPELVTAPLEVALRDVNPGVRAAGIRALGQVGGNRAVEILTGLLDTPGGEARSALLALAELGDGTTLSTLDVPADLFEAPRTRPALKVTHAWYVDATAGDDAGSGTTTAPLRTISEAVRRLSPGDRVYATAGDSQSAFRERVLIEAGKGGTQRNPTLVSTWPGRPPPVLDGFGEDRSKPGPGIGFQIEAAHVRLEGWTVVGYDESGIHLGGAFDAAVDCTVSRCERHGIFAYYAPHVSIVRPTVSDCAAQGISLRTSPFAVVAGGSSRDNGIDGLLLLQNTDQALIVDFTATGNRRGVGVMTQSDGARLINVDLRGNELDALNADPGCDVIEIGVLREDDPEPSLAP